MGQEQSLNEGGMMVHPYTNDMYMPVTATRMEDERSFVQPSSLCKTIHRPSILKTAFAGIWSLRQPNCIGPCPRTGFFCAYDEQNHTAYIGYGLDSNEKPLADFWALDTVTNLWHEIRLSGSPMSPRSGARATMYGKYVLVFGGFADLTYYGGLHSIDTTTGFVQLVETHGSEPSPVSSPIVQVYKDKLYVWGGFNGEYQNVLYVLEFSTMTWSNYPQDIAGRTAVPWVCVDNMIYSYGGSKAGGLLAINLDEMKVSVQQTIGAEPPSAVMNSGMVRVEHYLFFFGGRASSPWTLMYAMDMRRNWWFVFHILPDGESVSVVDGSISDNGLFMVPRLHNFGVVYEPRKREIMAFLGAPEKDPSPLFTIAIAPAMSIIHLRSDMSDALKFFNEKTN